MFSSRCIDFLLKSEPGSGFLVSGPVSSVGMDRFSWCAGLLEIEETLVIQQRGVRLSDGEDKVSAGCHRALFTQTMT